jgi:DNA-binding NarL/FixJ family response regulator
MIRVLIVDDHPIISAGVQALVGDQPDLEVTGCAPDGETAVLMAREDPPDVVVMDLSMRGMGGIAATSVIVAEHPAVHVLVLTWHADPARVRGALAAGATGYLLKDADHEELLDAIRAVHRGESRVSGMITRAMTS